MTGDHDMTLGDAGSGFVEFGLRSELLTTPARLSYEEFAPI